MGDMARSHGMPHTIVSKVLRPEPATRMLLAASVLDDSPRASCRPGIHSLSGEIMRMEAALCMLGDTQLLCMHCSMQLSSQLLHC